jgi:hydroxypyruvate isomerase
VSDESGRQRSVTLSANLGFLWTDRPLADAIIAAGQAGFDAVEFHQPFEHSVDGVRAALAEVDLPVITLNTGVGDPDAGELGLAALPGRQSEAQELIDEAIDYAAAISCRFVSVVGGRTGRTAEAEDAYRENLAYAAQAAAGHGVGVLIEPLNSRMAEDYHLVRMADGAATIEAVGADNLRLMADTFHVMTMENSLDEVTNWLDVVGHIQISGWPDRGEPDRASGQLVDFASWLPSMVAAGYGGPFGAEYTPRNGVEAGLGWLAHWHQEDER